MLQEKVVAMSSVLVDNACRLLIALVNELSLTASAADVSHTWICVSFEFSL